MYRLSVALIAVFMLAFSACTDEPERLEPEDDIIVEDDLTGMDDTDMYADDGFDAWDTSRDTYLDRTEFDARYDQMGLYDRYDPEGTGFISEEQYNTHIVTGGFDTAENFSAYDTDGDGQISREEFRTGLFNQMDADGDGRISREEFLRYESMMGGTSTGTTGTGATGTTPMNDPGM